MTDKWSGFADLMANLIAKYAMELELENLTDPILEKNEEKKADIDEISVDERMIARYN